MGIQRNLFESHNYIYSDDDGSRIPDKFTGLTFKNNAYLLAGVGFNAGKKSNISIQSGYIGIYGDRRAIPVLLRYKYAAKGSAADGAILIAGGGIGFPTGSSSSVIIANGSVGGGYRLVLGSNTSIDIQCTARLTYDKPQVYQKGSNRPVPDSRVLRNNAFYVSLNAGIAVNF